MHAPFVWQVMYTGTAVLLRVTQTDQRSLVYSVLVYVVDVVLRNISLQCTVEGAAIDSMARGWH